MMAGVTVCTPGQIANEIKVPISKVSYILATRDDIKPVGRAGIIRLYSRSSIEQVRRELDEIAARREAVNKK